MSSPHVRLSKRLSFVLRHQPESVGLTLDDGGWVDVETLLEALGRDGVPLARERLESVVRDSDKQRFTLDRERGRIRANQGHSRAVDLSLEAAAPPVTLYHGTPTRNLPAILEAGLHRAGRHAVHLSVDVATARRVGARRGAAAVLVVDALRMHDDGFRFEVSANGVWLTAHVPACYLSELDRPAAHRPAR